MEPAAEPHLGRMEDQEAAKQAGKEPKAEMAHPLIPLKPQIKLGLEEMVDMAAAAVVAAVTPVVAAVTVYNPVENAHLW